MSIIYIIKYRIASLLYHNSQDIIVAKSGFEPNLKRGKEVIKKIIEKNKVIKKIN